MSEGAVQQAWSRIEAWLRANAPQTFETLNPPADSAAIAAAEGVLGVRFPADLIASLLIQDGADSETQAQFGFPGGFALLALERIQRHWQMLTETLSGGTNEPMVGHWWHPHWIPFAALLTETADLLDGRRTDDHAVPRLVSGRCHY